jgi:hypothetical protein
MNRTPTADTHSPWYEAFSPAQNAEATHRLPGAAILPAGSEPEAAPSQSDGADDQWATEALFDYYNA